VAPANSARWNSAMSATVTISPALPGRLHEALIKRSYG
jgi:hypothetical protein